MNVVVKTETSDVADENFVDVNRIASTSSSRIAGTSAKINFRDNLMGAEAERLIVPSLGQIICLINASVAMEHYCIRSGDLSLRSMESYSVGEHRYITLELTMEFFNGMEILSLRSWP